MASATSNSSSLLKPFRQLSTISTATSSSSIPIQPSENTISNQETTILLQLLGEIIFFYLKFYVAFNTVQAISRRVVGTAEETSTYSSLGFCTVNCRPTASNYQLSHLRLCRGSNPGLRGGRRECYHSATVAPKWDYKGKPLFIGGLKCVIFWRERMVFITDIYIKEFANTKVINKGLQLNISKMFVILKPCRLYKGTNSKDWQWWEKCRYQTSYWVQDVIYPAIVHIKM